MACSMDDLATGGQLMVGAGTPPMLGLDSAKINGAAFIEGPAQVGAATEYRSVDATLMVGQTFNSDSLSPLYSLWSKFYSRFQSWVRVDVLLKAKYIEAKIVRTQILQASTKNFVIDHPTVPGKKLVHTCLEGPENGVYYRGRLKGKDQIQLPPYWTGLVDETTITVSITPVGAHQDIIVKRIGDNKVYLQARPGIPIDCFYHVYGTRKDVQRLIVEVEE